MNQDFNCEEKLEELQSEFNEFAYIISHDLKAPIRAISNLSVWIEEDLGENIPGDVQQNMHLLRNRAVRLERMIESLLTYSRVTSQDLDILPTDIKALVDDVLASLPEPGKLTLNLTDALPVIETYKLKLRAIINNLLLNVALHSNVPQTEVTLSLQELGDFYRFTIADNGGGVPAEALPKIFKIFYTVAPKDKVETSGAGLAISKKIVDFAGGKIEAENNEAGGLTVSFTWPKLN
ncbi:ATP-binding protein [Pontibacter sp. SGAir0037]|uniref:sensor histidine kinase n=1 Tax=Pontibacter sp. SGAir0037 TaxID=2571030 RepID=UPI0010CCF1BB|nr:HAMP domain-containing sensor histidine kinase [Pontibacter sp. SGAir0037]QCR22989.1 hypothetical protein C1N53_11975 [Pontibacter sp. SGAir0037]